MKIKNIAYFIANKALARQFKTSVENWGLEEFAIEKYHINCYKNNLRYSITISNTTKDLAIYSNLNNENILKEYFIIKLSRLNQNKIKDITEALFI